MVGIRVDGHLQGSADFPPLSGASESNVKIGKVNQFYNMNHKQYGVVNISFSLENTILLVCKIINYLL